MATTQSSSKESIDNRTRRACEGCMVVVPKGGGSGMFDVYSANDGHNKIYTVDLREERCICPDHHHREAECKHIRRVKLGLEIMPVPEEIELDGCLVDTRERYGADIDPNDLIDAHTPNSTVQEAVATDGGQLVETDTDTEIIDAGDDGEILDDSDAEQPAYTYHREPPEQGGEEYARCADCGYEILTKYGVHTLGHADGCSNGGEDR